MNNSRSRLRKMGHALRARGLIFFQQPGMDIWRGYGNNLTAAAARAELKLWEFQFMNSRGIFVFFDFMAMGVAVVAAIVSIVQSGVEVGHLSFLAVFLVFTGLSSGLHLGFHNDDYVRIRQWAFTVVRLGIAVVFLVWDARYSSDPFYITSTSLVVAGTIGLLLTASGSFVRYRRDQRRRSAKMENPWNTTYDLQPGTQYHMKQLSDRERVRRQNKAIGYMTDKTKQPLTERTACWYPQRPLIATVPEKHTPINIKDPYSSEPLFSRCYCCLDSDPFAETSKKLKKKWKSIRPSWLKKRRAFLKLPPISDFGDVPLPKSATENKTGTHNLCEKCEFVCSESNLINLYVGYHDWGTGPPPEMFEHHNSPKDLQYSATNESPCHLCALIWAVMSEEQQNKLLEIDDRVMKEMQVALDACTDEDEKEKKRLCEEYHQRRCITIRIEALTYNSGYTQTAFEAYALHVLWLGCGPRLIPHLGGTRIPRHWGNKRLVKEAIAVGLDPALVSKHMEQASGILIRGGYHKIARHENLMHMYLDQVMSIPVRGEYRRLNRSMAYKSWWATARFNNKGPIRPPVSSSTGSDETLDIATSWLKTHENCLHEQIETTGQASLAHEGVPLVDLNPRVATSQARALPTRLVDVSSEKIRLRLSSEIFAAGYGDLNVIDSRYVALSHCWAGSPFLTLTRENYQRFIDGEEVSALCQTFQDAIRVTRQLGYSYIWIDSLCIIQDTDDCLSELPKMGDVYANADCVIAAAAAWDNSETFFIPQSPLAMSPCLVSVAGKVEGMFRRFEGMYAFPASRFAYDADREISFARLNSRAWCLQELKLAKRILWFGHSQVQFICKGDEKIYSQASMFLEYAQHRIGRFGNRLDLVTKKLQDTSGLLTDQWWQIVEEYTSRWLTRDIDKLNAIGGVAQYFQLERPNVDYLAGLWSGPYFATGLLWYVADPRKAKTQSKPRVSSAVPGIDEDIDVGKTKRAYSAPSWSWASIDGIVSNNSYTGSGAPSTCLLSITDISHVAHTVASEAATAVAMAAPRIRITARGVVQRATWTVLPPSEPMHYLGHRPRHDIEYHKDLEILIPMTFDPSQGPKAFALMRSNISGGNSSEQAYDMSKEQVGWFIPDNEDDMPTELYCLRVLVEPESEEGKRDFMQPFVMRGVALVPIAQSVTSVDEGNSDPVTFRRVGYFELKRREGGLRYPDIAFSGPVSLTKSLLPARWPYPIVDPDGFFGGCAESVICIE